MSAAASSFGTINYAGTDWDVVAFIGSTAGTRIVAQPTTDQPSAEVIAEWMAVMQDGEASALLWDAGDLIGWLNDHGYNIVANGAPR